MIEEPILKFKTIYWLTMINFDERTFLNNQIQIRQELEKKILQIALESKV